MMNSIYFIAFLIMAHQGAEAFNSPAASNSFPRSSSLVRLADKKVSQPTATSMPVVRSTNWLSSSVNSAVASSTSLSASSTSLSSTSSSSTTSSYDPVYLFGKSQKNLNFPSLKWLLGGKGANLAEMSSLGLSVPPGFTVTTEVCRDFHQVYNKKLPKKIWKRVLNLLHKIEKLNQKYYGGKYSKSSGSYNDFADLDKEIASSPDDEDEVVFDDDYSSSTAGQGKPIVGDENNLLLLSVRSGAAVSMPGMMDTILNLGLNDDTVKILAKKFDAKFAYDSYRRFLSMFGSVVLGIPNHEFDGFIINYKKERGIKDDGALTEQDLEVIIQNYKEIYKRNNKKLVTNPLEQLYLAIQAVFNSWESDRAKKYRDAEGITGLLGTAVNVQAMVFGNMKSDSGTGVCFSRNPNNGEKKLYGEYLERAQGEDVVAGIRTPIPIAKLNEVSPQLYSELLNNVNLLEKHFKDMQDIEFTIEENKLYMLQTRSGKRNGQASVKIATDMVKEGLITESQAILQVKTEHLNQLLHPQFKDVKSGNYKNNVMTKGLPASPGAAVGRIAFTPAKAEEFFNNKEDCILVRDETSPEDVGGMWASKGVLTARGGMTSHAAVVARGWGKPCVCGCEDIKINEEEGTVTFYIKKGDNVTQLTLKEGDYISLNGDTGEVLNGKQEVLLPSIDASQESKLLMKWIDEKCKLKVLANADTPADALEARRNGAQGIGLTRTEHMFFEEDRIKLVRRMILVQDKKERQNALNELLPYQRNDFIGILSAMNGLSVTVRLLDPPLHEFLPHEEVDKEFLKELKMDEKEYQHILNKMKEINPMLGLRGCRLGIVMPEIIDMQARALMEATIINKLKGEDPKPELMIPLVGSSKEFSHQKNLIVKVFNDVYNEYLNGKSEAINNYVKEHNIKVPEKKIDMPTYRIGTMIEIPRATLIADELVKEGAEFFSYGTNDLTQMTYGFSRDDIGSFLPIYLKENILESDPFQTIDQQGVGKLIQNSYNTGKESIKKYNKSFFKAGVCGEHGGDPNSIKFFARSGLDYVSCSPYRVPVARLAGAQIAVEMEKEQNK